MEGSQNQQNWFTIKDDYRIVSIKNESTNYQFSNIHFPNAKYPYYRLLIKTNQAVALKKATLDLQKRTAANYQSYPIVSQSVTTNKQQKTSVLDVELKRPAPLSFLKFKVTDDFDFYRPMTIQYLSDSIKRDKGWRYQYRNLHQNVISSLEPNEFTFKSTLARKLKIIIQNHDNPTLTIDSITIKGYQHQLIARFTQSAEYFLIYGRKNAASPSYDIGLFEDKIPPNLSTLSLATEQIIPKIEPPKRKPIFENKWWLWGLMLTIIGLLGWFTLKMLEER